MPRTITEMQDTVTGVPQSIAEMQKEAERRQCRHVFADGLRCGSPAMRRTHFCYYHHDARKPVPQPRLRQARRNLFLLRAPNTRASIQSSLGEVIHLLSNNNIDTRRASLILYALQIATTNLTASQKDRKDEPTAAPADLKSESAAPETRQDAIASEPTEPTPASAPAFDSAFGSLSRATAAALIEQLAKQHRADIEEAPNHANTAILQRVNATAEDHENRMHHLRRVAPKAANRAQPNPSSSAHAECTTSGV